MGWWKAGKKGVLVGDDPLDLLNDALRAISASYAEWRGSPPTREEWEALIALGLPSYLQDGRESIAVLIRDGNVDGPAAPTADDGSRPH